MPEAACVPDSGTRRYSFNVPDAALVTLGTSLDGWL